MIKKILFSILILQSCATAYDEIFVLIKNQTIGYPNQEVTMDAFQEAKFSFMTVRVGRNPKIKLVLSSVNDGVYEWVSSDMHTIHTYQGLIIKTTGLPHNIHLRQFRKFNPMLLKNHNLIAEFDKPMLAGTPLILSFASKKNKSDTNIYSDIDSYTYDRVIDSIGWKAKDEYWLSGGMIIFARQNIHPQLAKIETEFFYKF